MQSVLESRRARRRAVATVSPRVLAGAAVLAVSASAMAQLSGARGPDRDGNGLRDAESAAGLRMLPPMWVTRLGRAEGPFAVQRACNGESRYTAFNFAAPPQFAQVKIEAGMGETEMAACSYVLTAADFPLKLDTADIVWGANSSVTTTTHWSVHVYSGLPSTGTEVFTAASDGDILPHIVIPPGANGVPVSFMVDPSDPEQIIVQDPTDGSHALSIAFRIDHHNQQTQDPCTVAPPNCCNAFPCVDTDGLSNSANNWLFGMNCGPFGCPANGGWARFSSLPGFCRPTGDWMMRATWERVNCAPPAGACCFPDGTCQVVGNTACPQQGGTYQGDGTTCGTVNCPPPLGACCFNNGNCLSRNATDCATLSGTWQGPLTTCNGTLCPTGACCFSGGTCSVLTSQACTTQSGTYHGNGVTCAAANCPQPTGACCTAGGCSLQVQGDCTIAGGIWGGLGSSCATACMGACCTAGGCSQQSSGDCGIAGGVWHGVGSTCPGACSPVCYANCDNSTSQPLLNVADFTCFLQRYAAAEAYANCDGSTTQPTLNVQDFTCFLQKYAAGCS